MNSGKVSLAAVMAAAVFMLPGVVSAQVSGKFKWSSTGNAFQSDFRYPVASGKAGAAYRASFMIPSHPVDALLPIHGQGTFGPIVDVFCIDFHHAPNKSVSGYDVYFTNLGSGTLTKTRSGDLSRYLKTAWLVQKMETFGTGPSFTTANRDTRRTIHAALWQVMSGAPTEVYLQGTSSWDAAGVTTWVNLANANYTDGSVNANLWSVVTAKCVTDVGNNLKGSDASDNCSQEFLAYNIVPEPATLMLLATGLLLTLGATGMIRRPLG